jgi:hypothetical protein
MTGTDVNNMKCLIPIPYAQAMSIPCAFTIDCVDFTIQPSVLSSRRYRDHSYPIKFWRVGQ